jgi:ABC-type antimicrobial peptide transport system permease subunit
VAAVPGIVSVTLEHQNAMHPTIVRPESGIERRDTNVTPVVKAVDLNYFETFGTRLVSGRLFAAGDAPGAPLVAIINKAAADVFWPGRNPLGRRVFVGDSASAGEMLTVIGVAANAERGELVQRHWPMVYRPFRQGRIYHAAARLYVRAGDDNPAVLAAAERAIRETTSRKAIPFTADEEKLNNRLLGRRFAAIALDVFAAFGLMLAAMGVYGSVAYAAKRRTREIGIRMALGARRWGVVGLVARRGVLVALAGSAAGVIGATMLMQVFKASALTTTVATPWIFAGSVLLMVVVVLVATLLPAARATRVDVVIALRAE